MRYKVRNKFLNGTHLFTIIFNYHAVLRLFSSLFGRFFNYLVIFSSKESRNLGLFGD